MNRLSIVALWLVFMLVLWGEFSWILREGNLASNPPTVSVESYNEAQHELHEQIIAKKGVLLPIDTIILYGDDGPKQIYVYGDGTWTSEPPEWYQDGIIMLSESEIREIASLSVVQTPPWMFWAREMTYRDYGYLHMSLGTGMILGLIVGILFGCFIKIEDGLLVAITFSAGCCWLFFWLFSSSTVGLSAGYLLGSVTGTVVALAGGIIYISKRYWNTLNTGGVMA